MTPTISPTTNATNTKHVTSPQLNRWSIARSIRSGRKLDRPVQPKQHQTIDQEPEPAVTSPCFSTSSSENDTEEFVRGKEIYMVSDGSGRTAEHSVTAALGQFEHFFVDGGCPVYTRLFSGINDLDRLMEIIMQAAKEDAILIYTLADENLAESARRACKSWGVQSTDVLRPITDAIASYLGISPSGLPRGAPGRRFPLTDTYFKRIDAIEFTIKQDDGAFPQNLHKADIVVAGVSRSGVDLPKTLFEVDQKKVFALTLNPVMLQTIRLERAKSLGYHEDEGSDYAEMAHVREELEYAYKIFTQNPTWPVIEVTGKAIEEIAAIILRVYQDRKHGSPVPIISKLY
ncbi:putative transferase [Helianthus debilis subsp. tardiflorus]